MSAAPTVRPTHLSLGALQPGESGRVVALGKTDRQYRERLLSFGLTPGTTFDVVRMAPLGDPIEIRVRGFALSLRRGEAQAVTVERTAP
ncbi:MAG: ferrous iron transport protein A [Alphaproteobacteria bacterium]|nr:ferrous iron transport protein A [Alphaproteobacteria bacterium]